MQQLDLQAFIFDRQAFDPETAFILRSADRAPCHQAFRATGAILDIPEESPAQPLDRAQERRWQLDGPHCEGGEGVKHGVQQHQPAARGEQNRRPPREIYIHLTKLESLIV
jgi:hypothetical protein